MDELIDIHGDAIETESLVQALTRTGVRLVNSSASKATLLGLLTAGTAIVLKDAAATHHLPSAAMNAAMAVYNGAVINQLSSEMR